MKKIILLTIFVPCLVGTLAFAAGTRIYFKGPTVDIAPGSEIALSIFVDSDAPINTIDVELEYSKDVLEFLSFDNTNSIIDIWPSKPEVVAEGHIGFSGGIIKSFQGTAGLVGKIYFKTKAVGNPEINFTKSDAYIADGKGTMGDVATATFTFSIREGGRVLSSQASGFQSTPADILIEGNLENIKSEESRKTLLYSLGGGIFVVLIALLVYNKYRRKKN